MSAESNFRIPSGYERGIRFGANWTMAISPYLILYVILVFSLGNPNDTGNIVTTLEFAGSSPTAYKAIVLLDGLSHALGFVMIVSLFAVLREAFPIRASLIVVFGAWQMIVGYTKGLVASYLFTQLGLAYLMADANLRASIIPTANAMNGLHNALEKMDSLGVMFVWILVSLLPQSTNLPRPIRWFGWIMTFGILLPDSLPGFLFVVLFSPPWLFLLGRWMKRLALAPKEAL